MIIFLLRYQQKVTQNYLSKVTNYNYFVTEQHCISNEGLMVRGISVSDAELSATLMAV